jgi:hypothetical protein
MLRRALIQQRTAEHFVPWRHAKMFDLINDYDLDQIIQQADDAQHMPPSDDAEWADLYAVQS